MLAVVSLGFGEIVGSLSIGQVIDRAGNLTTSAITLLLIILQTFLTLSFVRSGTYGSLVFIMMFVWGLQDSVVNTHISEILGFEFEDNTRPFSVFNICQCIAMAIFSIIQISVDTQVEYIIFAIFVSILGMVACGNTLRFQFRE